jgi:hypothetical protein
MHVEFGPSPRDDHFLPTVESRGTRCSPPALTYRQFARRQLSFPETAPAHAGRHLPLRLHDARVAVPGELQGAEHVADLLELTLVGQWDRCAPILNS